MRTFHVGMIACVLATGLLAQEVRARPAGVDERIEHAIQRGLEYLVRTQNRDGSWRASGGYGTYPTAMTGLAGIAILCSGSTPTRGRHWRAVRDSAEFLLRSASNDGVITAMAEEGRSMYGHGFATLYLAEVYGMEEDVRRQEKLHTVLTKAVSLISRAQSGRGGWYYTPESGSDEGSVTVTQLQALRACRNAGISVPVKTIERAVGYIKASANPDGGIRYAAGQGGPSRPPITAAAVSVLYYAGRYDDPMAEKALRFSLQHLPVNGSGNGHHYYAQFYLAQALYQKGGKDWDDYYQKMSGWLLGQQQTDGSWQGDGVGSTYGTAIALVILQLPYAFVPIYQR
jgi:squalene cyclase